MTREPAKLRRCRRIAVMGGTFDPIHYGHLAAAEAVRHALNPDIVLFIVSGSPPHKDIARVTGSEHRYAMTLLATAENPCFDVSRIELERPGASYTVDTIRTLKEICPADAEIFFVTGADAVAGLPDWKESEALLTLCRFVAVARPGYVWDTKRLADKNIIPLEIPSVAVSGTALRERVAAGQPIRYLLPPAVEQYIYQNGLYTQGNIPGKPPYDAAALILLLKNRLTEERYTHTLGVAKEAVRLAKHYGVNVEKARLAGLLHDCAKEYGRDKKRTLCRIYGIALDEVTDKQIDLTHSALSAEAARREYGVEDEEILQAIKYHTTGHAHMTMMDKVVMLADYIEPTREDYPGLEKMRSLAMTDMDGALRVGIKQVIEFNKKRGRLIHPDSKKALRSLKSK